MTTGKIKSNTSSGCCCNRIVHSKSAKFLKFFVLLVLGCINLCIDWFFYTRVDLIEPGLIYGPPDKHLKLTIFAFCVISTVGLVVEVIHNVDDISDTRKIRILSTHLTNFFDIIFTDLPMLTLNLIITACHDGQPTLISVVKSSVCILVIVVRFLIISFNKCARFGSNKTGSRFKTIIELLTILGLVLALLISVKIQLLRIFPTRHDGFGFLRPDPLKFKSLDFIKTTYTNNVGIFVQWPLKSESIVQTNTSSGDSYLWITDINEVIDQTYIEIQIETNFSNTSYQNKQYATCITKNDIKECFITNRDSGYVVPSGVAFSNKSEVTEKFLLTLTKEPAQAYRYLFGYVDYNLNRLVTRSDGSLECTKGRLNLAIYAKFLPFSMPEKMSYFRRNGQKLLSFYNRGVDLETVDTFWRTGVFGCKMSGDLGPKFNERIRLQC